MNEAELTLNRQRFKAAQEAILPAVERVKKMCAEIQESMRFITACDELTVTPVLFGKCVHVVEGEDNPTYEVSGQHNTMRGPSIPGLHGDVEGLGNAIQKMFSGMAPDVNAFTIPMPPPGSNIFGGTPFPPPEPDAVKPKKVVHRHPICAEISVHLEDRGLHILTIADITKFTEEMVKPVAKEIYDSFSDPDGYLSELILEVNKQFGCGQPGSLEHELAKRMLKKTKRDMDDLDESDKWRGSEDK